MARDDPLGGKRHADFDVSKPNVARVYDALLGGKDNFAADREFVAEILRLAPMAPLGAISNRQFLRRVVQYLVVDAGITQFLDLGSGLPTQGNVSDVAHQFSPGARVIHVDNDPVAYTHSKALLADARTTDFVLGDLLRPDEILADPLVQSMIDFDQPVGLLFLGVLHHIADSDHPERVVAEYRAAMPSGSQLAITSLRMPGPDLPEYRTSVIESEKLYSGSLGAMRWREDSEILSWFGGWEMIPPGLVPTGDWRPPVPGHVPHPEIHHTLSGGVAKKK